MTVGALVLSGIPVLLGSPRLLIHVTWLDVGPAEQTALERAFGLSAPMPLTDTRWAYEPLDTSTEMLGAIVSHQSVADTGGIDQRALTMASPPLLSSRRGGLLGTVPTWAGRLAKLIAYALFVAAAAALVLFRETVARRPPPSLCELRARWLAFLANPAGLIVAWCLRIREWMQRGVPTASAEAAGLFRIVFGTGVLVVVVTEPANIALLESYEASATQGVYGAIVHWLGAHPAVPQGLGWWLNISGALFIAGVFTTVSFGCFVLGFLVWATIFTLTTSTHAVAVLGLTLIALLPARWGAAWSVDALFGRVLGRPRDSMADGQHGYVFWIPRLVFGLAFLAAAWSKMGGGLGWILNGTVKYHFISDLDQALVDWGRRLTQSHWAAVAMSGAAVATEALVITAAFSQSVTHVWLCGAGALTLLAGFALFQGVVWPGWWILLIAFLPWQRLGRSPHLPLKPATLDVAQLVVVAMVVAQQFLASAFHFEARPLISAYDMYSATYGSAEEYEHASNLVYRVVVYDNDQARGDLPGCLVDDRTASLLPAAAAGAAEERARLRSLIGPCMRTQTSITAFALEGDRRVYDWNARRFEMARRVDVIGPFPADWLRP
jgi:hypothetical protein